MRVEALKTENGFFIPVNEALRHIRQDRILLEIEIIGQDEKRDDIDRFFDQYNFDLSQFRFDREEANER